MPRTERAATIAWEGNVARGHGTVESTTSGELRGETISLATRVGDPDGTTSPEELIAAAHAGCFAMALSNELSKLDKPPERLEATCTITLDEIGENHGIVRSELRVRGRVPGIGAEEFRHAAERAKDGCVVSRALDTEITLDARLDQ
jgi:osmotically inducible protein OsmC